MDAPVANGSSKVRIATNSPLYVASSGAAVDAAACPFSDLTAESLSSFLDHALAEVAPPALAEPPLVTLSPKKLASTEAAPAKTPRVTGLLPTTAPLRRPARRLRFVLFAASLALGAAGIGMAANLAVRAFSPSPHGRAPALRPGIGAEATSASIPGPMPAATSPVDSVSACRATVTTEPAGAMVFVGARLVGVTPFLSMPVPCGPGTLAIRHPRYARITKAVVLQPGQTLALDEKLVRPSGDLVLVSSPPGATFTVAGKPLEAGLAREQIRAFKFTTVTASMPGFQPWTQTIYPMSRETAIRVNLTPHLPAPSKADTY